MLSQWIRTCISITESRWFKSGHAPLEFFPIVFFYVTGGTQADALTDGKRMPPPIPRNQPTYLPALRNTSGIFALPFPLSLRYPYAYTPLFIANHYSPKIAKYTKVLYKLNPYYIFVKLNEYKQI